MAKKRRGRENLGRTLDDAGSRWWVWAVAVPVAATVMITFIIGAEADSSGEMMIGSLLCSAALGLIIAAMGRGFWQTCAAAIWFPVLIAWRRWDWLLDMHSPRGAAQSMAAEYLGWQNAPGLLAFALFQFAAVAIGWGVVAFNVQLKKRTGWSFLDEE